MKNITIVLVVLVLIVIGIYFFNKSSSSITVNNNTVVPTETTKIEEEQIQNEELQTVEPIDNTKTVIGKSVENNDITAYHYGSGDTELLFVGGIHGGYSWNTTLVAYELMDYLDANPDAISANVKVTVIPVLNPDGLSSVVGTTGRFTVADVSSSEATVVAGRFNANDVDLNRNFDCDWKSTGTWQNKTVSGGSEAFSEPESEAIRAYVDAHTPSAVVVWYSAAGGVFASNCHNGVLPETQTLTNTFAKASGYKAYDSFDFYQITGDMVNWLAKNNIPAISVLLTNHQDTEWTKNKAGITALLKYYAE